MQPTPAIESLEARIAPAAVFTYTEPDGDRVTVKSSLGSSPGLLLAATFDTPMAATKSLLRLDLDFAPGQFEGADISITVTQRGEQGDGLVSVGAIDATGMDLGKVVVQGDLGQIDAGNLSRTGPGLKSLSVHSMGAVGLASQGGSGDLGSAIAGAIGKVTVKTDLTGVQIGNTGADSSIGPVKIGGAVRSSVITAVGDLASIMVGQDVRGDSSMIRSLTGDIGPVKIGGDLVAGSQTMSGAVQADAGSIKSVAIGGNIIGGPAGMAGTGINGGVVAGKSIGSVSVGGDIVVDPAYRKTFNGDFFTGIAAGQDIGTVKVRGEIRGAGVSEPVVIAAFKSPAPNNPTAIKSVMIGGNVFGLEIVSSGPDSVIGKVTAGGDWGAGNVLAGVARSGFDAGDGNDLVVPGDEAGASSRIGSIAIKGNVLTLGFATGFLAEEIGSVSVNGGKFKLKPAGAGEDRFVIGSSGNVRVYEV